ncbi:hypothetical protein OG723_12295 [Streptomyces sp. NBC_01278]|uniref:hypothetical protein n=1 Tax=unclassified Streptomyces TaxID=2593676 RepID=UPI002E12FEA4|nr:MULTISPECIES: hypothetical protein [unclassified Streptomyces]WSR24842.1 hypothetical protein OG573_01030 [Streptomyces sp. NBC_01205]
MNPTEIRESLDRKVQHIRGQNNLTSRAKQTMVARAFIEARDALDQLREQDVARIERQREQLDRKLFGTNGFSPDPNTVIARRDANDRAAKLESPAEAAHAMRRAEREGDRIMAKAIAAKAADYSGDPSWAQLLNQYVEGKPEETATLQAMVDLPDTNDGVWRISKAIEYSIATPSELGDQRPEGLAALPLDGDAPTAA